MRLPSVNHYHKAIFFIFMYLLAGSCFSATQTLTVSEGKRLEANIAPDVMNRLSVSNDRITQLFGDDDSFVSQNDEQTGQIFIKPTVNNDSKPLSITLITENGITQDLNLKPTATEPSTIILKNLNNSQSKNPTFGCEGTSHSMQAEASSEQWVQIMKQAVLGELPLYDKKVPSRQALRSQTSFVKAYQSGPYLVSVWSIRHAGSSGTLCENLFYQAGDLAICLQDRCLKTGKKTLLYVLTRV